VGKGYTLGSGGIADDCAFCHFDIAILFTIERFRDCLQLKQSVFDFSDMIEGEDVRIYLITQTKTRGYVIGLNIRRR